jgi:ferredoxin
VSSSDVAAQEAHEEKATVRIDQSLCQGHGRCYDLHPGLFASDEEGYGVPLAVVTSMQEARAAGLDCPEAAIEVVAVASDSPLGREKQGEM